MECPHGQWQHLTATTNASEVIPGKPLKLKINSFNFLKNPDKKTKVLDQIIPTISARKQFFEMQDDYDRTFIHLAAISG